MKKKVITICFSILSFTLISQIRVDLKTGIENPYNYSYNIEQFPSQSGYGEQEFNFFRTKLISCGISYDFKLGSSERWVVNFGAQLGYLHQFIADTIISPKKDALLYSVTNQIYFIEPRFSIGYVFYKNISFHIGLDGFIPIKKTIFSENENIIFTSDLGKRFYPADPYARLAIQYKKNRFVFAIEGQQSGDYSIFWLKYPYINLRSNPKHTPQRLMISASYILVKPKNSNKEIRKSISILNKS